MTLAVIPSRFGSRRFQGKPLALLAGKPMIQRVYEQAVRAPSLDRVVVATDHEKILKTVEGFGGEALMTPSNLPSGTDRVRHACRQLGVSNNEIVINIQGDQPVFSPQLLEILLPPFREPHPPQITTPAVQILDQRKLTDPSTVKVVMDLKGRALYFSRSHIPFPRDGKAFTPAFHHLGFYAYTAGFLDIFAGLEEGVLEKTEKLEQLRALAHGYEIRVMVSSYDSPSVDTPDDLQNIEKSFFSHAPDAS